MKYLRGIRSRNKKDIHIKVKIKGNIDKKEQMELLEEVWKALTRINHLHNERVSYKIENCNYEKAVKNCNDLEF